MSSSGAGVAKYEIDVITEFQKEIHDETQSEDGIDSAFYKEYVKSTWWTRATEQLLTKSSADTQVIYEANPTFHWLMSTYKVQEFPALEVKELYKDIIQICWPHNLASTTTEFATFKISNDTTIQGFDHHWLNIYSQFFMKPGANFDRLYDESVGNEPFLEEWSDFLPAYTTSEDQPFSFSRDSSSSFPLFMMGSLNRVEFHYRNRNKIGDILRMRGRKKNFEPESEPESESDSVSSLLDGFSNNENAVRSKNKHKSEPKATYGPWVDIPFNQKYIQGCNSNCELPIPKIFGRFAYMSDKEKAWWMDCKDGYTSYIEDVISCDSPSEQQYGSTVDIPLSGNSPAKAIFWVAENVQARKNRNYGNYTTNYSDLKKGWNPISKVSLRYQNNDKFKDMDSFHFSRMEPLYNFPSAPRYKGFNAWSFANDPCNLNADISTDLSEHKAHLLVLLGNTNPHLKPVIKIENTRGRIEELEELDSTSVSKNYDSNSDKFKVIVRILVMKKLQITKAEKDFKCIIR